MISKNPGYASKRFGCTGVTVFTEKGWYPGETVRSVKMFEMLLKRYDPN